MATIWVDNRAYEVDGTRNLLDVCLTLGFNLPYFCWHPAMGSVGACRQCAVKQFKDEHDTCGRLVMACMTPAAEGTRISISDPDAVLFRKGVVEGLMLNHPHDCPVCDEGGECHLQDMTVMAGHDYRRTRFPKRTFRNQYLGPLVNHEMNRCIQCYRCVRFYREYAGGRDLNAFAIRNLVYFGRRQDGVLESEFSGNLVEVCPTGVFTDATLKQHYTRKWDLQFAPSVCVHCGLGCNTSPGERYGTLRRIANRYNGQVNGYFLCDRGRYGYEFVHSERRIREPLWKGKRVERNAAIEHLRALVTQPAKAIGIGSPRASLEANFALRELVGPERFFLGMADDQVRLVSLMLDILRGGPARSPSLKEIELSDAVFVVGEDVPNVAPRMALTLRQSARQQPIHAVVEKLKVPLWNDHAVREAVQEARGPLFIATPQPTRLDEVASETYRAAPADIARLGFAVARALDAAAPIVLDLPPDIQALAERIAGALRNARQPVVISGPSLASEAVIQAAANVARALSRGGRPAHLSYLAPECNTVGLALIGGGKFGEAFEAVRNAAAETVIVLENDLYRRAPSAAVDAFLDSAKHVVALDCLANRVTAKAELVLPASSFAESGGTLVSNEGRAQRFFQVFAPKGDIQESWRWLRDVMPLAGREEARAWANLDDVIEAVSRSLPVLAGVCDAAPLSRFHMAGGKVPREPHRYSGRTAMLANINVSEPKPPDDPDSPLSFSMEGDPGRPPSALTPFFWTPAWNSIQALNKFQEEIAGPLRGGDPGVRLIEPAAGADQPYFAPVPQAFAPRRGQWLAVPLYAIFGSDEVSMASPPVASLSPKPCLVLNSEDAAALQVRAGETIDIEFDGAAHRLPVEIMPELPKGLVGAPAGMPPFEGVSLPAWSRLTKAP